MESSYRGGKNVEKISELSALDQAILLYQRERYAPSADKFVEHLEANPEHVMSKFYAGVAFLACNKPEEAYPLLSESLTDPYSDFKLHAKWYLSISCLETNRLGEARELLLDLQLDSTYTEYASRASEILRKHPLLLCADENMPVFSVKDNTYLRNDSASASLKMENRVHLSASTDKKFLKVSFTENISEECMLKLYDERGLLIHMERIVNPSSSSNVADISLTYKQEGFYNLLIQVGDQEILPFRILI